MDVRIIIIRFRWWNGNWWFNWWIR